MRVAAGGACFFFVASCGAPSWTEMPGDLGGVVCRDRRPSAATVEVSRDGALVDAIVTDEDGSWTATDVARGEVTVAVLVDGEEPRSLGVVRVEPDTLTSVNDPQCE